MSSSRSGFASTSSAKSPLLSHSSHELPPWRSPSPTASMIPPPIVQSMYQTPQNAAKEVKITTRVSQADDRQLELEADLQFLLDAQADGLIRGLGGAGAGAGSVTGAGDRSSAGSTTPTMQSVRSTSTRRMRKPPRRQPGLRSARKGIYRSIIALASLKDEELYEIDAVIRGNQQTLEQIDTWETKHKGLREASRNLDGNEETIRIQRLRSEADSVQEGIFKVELQLAEMKTKHRKLLKQAAAIENSVQAKMASYTSSLRMLEEDVHKFLSFKPSAETTRPLSREGSSSVWQLPVKRRNLEMAKEYWSEQHESSVRQRKQSEFEKEALVEGASLWAETVTEITGFEKQLRAEMATLAPSLTDSHSAWEEPPTTTASERLQGLIEQMDELTASLQRKLTVSHERNWKLLLVAIGAELEALRSGRDILAGVLGDANEDHRDEVTPERDFVERGNGGEIIEQLDKSFMTARGTAVEHSDAEEDDDHPNPELLFTKHEDTDTD